MVTKPLISVIIPTYNSSKTISRCLVSIKKQQNIKTEIIVVDEFSTDKTQVISQKFATVYEIKGERSVARNYGAAKSAGRYLLFIDSDMEFTPMLIEECIKASEGKYPVVIPEISTASGFWGECRVLERRCYYDNDFIEAARFFPKELFMSVGGYDETMAGVEDWDLHQRVRNTGISIKRTESYIIHHEGKIKLFWDLKKKLYYGQVFNHYRKRHPEAFRKAFTRNSFISNWRILLEDPIHAVGVFVMKGLEGAALIIGMAQGILYGYDPQKHYR